MAVVRKNESLADSDIKKVADVKPTKGPKIDTISLKKKEIKPPKKKEKKAGFLKTTIQELKKVTWPTWRYTFTWAGIVIIFTIIMSTSLGFFDNIFESGMRYVDCTAEYKTSEKKEEADKDYNQCGQDLIDNLAFKGD